jgi:hypothetical protein
VDVVDWMNALQWPGMLTTLLATWLVASESKRRRTAGFWVYISSNFFWTLWGWHTGAYAVVAMQFCLAGLNLRGISNNDPEALKPAMAQSSTGST